MDRCSVEKNPQLQLTASCLKDIPSSFPLFQDSVLVLAIQCLVWVQMNRYLVEKTSVMIR